MHNSELGLNFAVEISSFIGVSAITIATVMRELRLKLVILCIDTRLGGMNMRINKEVYKYLAYVNVRPQVYEQLIANVLGHNFTTIILPFLTISIYGARLFHIFHFDPQAVFLDSAHERDEL